MMLFRAARVVWKSDTLVWPLDVIKPHILSRSIVGLGSFLLSKIITRTFEMNECLSSSIEITVQCKRVRTVVCLPRLKMCFDKNSTFKTHL